MSQASKTIIGPDMVVTGDVRTSGEIEVRGYIEGTLATERLLVVEGGRVFGTIRAGSADVRGRMQGTVAVKTLMNIASTGSVRGDVRYGQLALASGGELEAEVRNVPPEIAGDLQVAVRRGRSVRITNADLTAIDPDDRPENLIFHVTSSSGGRLARASEPGLAVESFSAADIAAGAIDFEHDGSAGLKASFSVDVRDASGAMSGTPVTVNVAVY